MNDQRITRVNELLRREIGSSLYRVINETDCDLSAVTVTHVITSRDLRTARVLLSIRGDQDQQKRMLSRIVRHRIDIQEVIHKNVILKYTPRLTFSLDSSLEAGDRVLGILRGLDGETQDDTNV
jgi:ribosome-binding factor A